MNKTRLSLIVLLVLLIVSGFITFQFYSQKENLINKNKQLEQEKAKLTTDNQSLYSQYSDVKEQLQAKSNRLANIQKELTSLEQAKEELQNKYQEVFSEKQSLASKIKKLTQVQKIAITPISHSNANANTNVGYWADVVREKVALQAKLEGLSNELLEAKTQLSKLQINNKELSLKIDGLNKTQNKLNMNIAFKERTLEIMSKDLVNERESRESIANELSQLRDSNMGLKRELIIADRDKIKLQGMLGDTIKKRAELAKQVSNITNILKEKKSIIFQLAESA